ncbi:MAG: IS200/IS605 family transposase [Candidatus Cloacimonetes bacterium]|nr:IS200/IS605 family transposase [Candidatus Cloacimonadota bacterium]
MSTYTQILYHIVFSTKNRERTLDIAHRERILKYIWGIIKNTKSHLYQINLMEDHVHILCSIHPTICLSDFVKKIKTSAGVWMKEEEISPLFTNWQAGYGAFTVAWHDKDTIMEYIKNQQEHHKIMDFRSEYQKLLDEFGIDYDKMYLP